MTAKKRVLVIDDSETVLEAAEAALEEGGYEVVTLNSAGLFLRALQQQAPDLVLVDVSMPVLGGDLLVDIARRNQLGRCPIVLYSDRDPAELARLAKSCGADGFIPKSTRGAAFLATVARYLQDRGPAAREAKPQAALVCDGATARPQVARAFREGGFDLTVFPDAPACVDARSLPPTVVLVDVGAARREATLKRLRHARLFSATAIIAYADSVTSGDLAQLLRHGADDVLVGASALEAPLAARLAALRVRGAMPSLATSRTMLVARDRFLREFVGGSLELAGLLVCYPESLEDVPRSVGSVQSALVDLACPAPDGLEALRSLKRAGVKVATCASAPLTEQVRKEAIALTGGAPIGPDQLEVEALVSALFSLTQKAAPRLQLTPRASLITSVELSRPGTPARLVGISFNVSRNGIFVRTLAPEPPQSRLEVRLTAPSGQELAKGSGVVVWANRFADRTIFSYPLGMGIHLQEVDERFKALVGELVAKGPTT